MFQTFKEYLATLGILVPKEPSTEPEEVDYTSITNPEFDTIRDSVIADDFESVPEVVNFETIDGDGCGVKYPISDNQAVRFDCNPLDNKVVAINIFVNDQVTPVTEIVLNGAQVQDVIDDIQKVLEGTVDSYEREIEYPNTNIRRYLPYDTVESITEEGIQYSKDYCFKDNTNSYSVHDLKTSTKKDMVEQLWNSGRSSSDISEITSFAPSIIKSSLKAIGAIKTIDVRPGKLNKFR